MTHQNEEFLKSYFITEGHDILAYQNLSEEDKTMFSRDIVGKIVKAIEDKEYQIDNVAINKSKGIIKDLDNYSYIKTSLELMNNMQASLEEKIPYLDILNDAHKNLIDFADEFNRGFKLNKSIVKIFYSSLVLSLIQNISFLISTSMDYVKDPLGNYQTVVRYNLNKKNKYPTVSFECLDTFNLMAKNGELNHFFTRIFTDKTLQESSNLFAELLMAGIEVAGDFGAVLVGIAKFIPSIPELLRMFVSLFYNTRVELSDYLRTQSYFIELNVERNKNLANPNTKSIKKQEKIVKSLIKLADKIDIDQKTADKKTKIEIEQQNKNISKSIKESKSNSQPRENSSTVEEIIL